MKNTPTTSSDFNSKSRNLRIGIVTLLVLFITNLGFAQVKKAELVKERQTSLGLYVTAEEAYAMWKANPEKVKILDVRMPEEYVFVGHPEMAVCIPLALGTYEWDDEKKMYKVVPNTDFMVQVKKLYKTDDIILATCRSGGRGAMAVNAMAAAGYTKVYNIIDGIEGDVEKDPSSSNNGKRTVNGWKNSGLPWTYEVNPELMKLPQK
jgi:rhodanese-related sulfurtransferase